MVNFRSFSGSLSQLPSMPSFSSSSKRNSEEDVATPVVIDDLQPNPTPLAMPRSYSLPPSTPLSALPAASSSSSMAFPSQPTTENDGTPYRRSRDYDAFIAPSPSRPTTENTGTPHRRPRDYDAFIATSPTTHRVVIAPLNKIKQRTNALMDQITGAAVSEEVKRVEKEMREEKRKARCGACKVVFAGEAELAKHLTLFPAHVEAIEAKRQGHRRPREPQHSFSTPALLEHPHGDSSSSNTRPRPHRRRSSTRNAKARSRSPGSSTRRRHRSKEHSTSKKAHPKEDLFMDAETGSIDSQDTCVDGPVKAVHDPSGSSKKHRRSHSKMHRNSSHDQGSSSRDYSGLLDGIEKPQIVERPQRSRRKTQPSYDPNNPPPLIDYAGRNMEQGRQSVRRLEEAGELARLAREANQGRITQLEDDGLVTRFEGANHVIRGIRRGLSDGMVTALATMPERPPAKAAIDPRRERIEKAARHRSRDADTEISWLSENAEGESVVHGESPAVEHAPTMVGVELAPSLLAYTPVAITRRRAVNNVHDDAATLHEGRSLDSPLTYQSTGATDKSGYSTFLPNLQAPPSRSKPRTHRSASASSASLLMAKPAEPSQQPPLPPRRSTDWLGQLRNEVAAANANDDAIWTPLPLSTPIKGFFDKIDLASSPCDSTTPVGARTPQTPTSDDGTPRVAYPATPISPLDVRRTQGTAATTVDSSAKGKTPLRGLDFDDDENENDIGESQLPYAHASQADETDDSDGSEDDDDEEDGEEGQGGDLIDMTSTVNDGSSEATTESSTTETSSSEGPVAATTTLEPPAPIQEQRKPTAGVILSTRQPSNPAARTAAAVAAASATSMPASAPSAAPALSPPFSPPTSPTRVPMDSNRVVKISKPLPPTPAPAPFYGRTFYAAPPPSTIIEGTEYSSSSCSDDREGEGDGSADGGETWLEAEQGESDADDFDFYAISLGSASQGSKARQGSGVAGSSAPGPLPATAIVTAKSAPKSTSISTSTSMASRRPLPLAPASTLVSNSPPPSRGPMSPDGVVSGTAGGMASGSISGSASANRIPSYPSSLSSSRNKGKNSLLRGKTADSDITLVSPPPTASITTTPRSLTSPTTPASPSSPSSSSRIRPAPPSPSNSVLRNRQWAEGLWDDVMGRVGEGLNVR